MDFTDVIRYFGALALVLALVGGAGLAMRRYGLPGLPGSAARRLRIVESLILGRNHRFVIVRCDGTDHLMVIAPQGATLVTSLVAAQFANQIPAAPAVETAP